ncbi:hypothetical protein ACH5RR_040948 [Cinchona calisaya]|uniref:Uncharacterized protein n=1 Tax=Cinchona calisaya TaxID=153742 RepID=A0ABD2XSN2_9GENT
MPKKKAPLKAITAQIVASCPPPWERWCPSLAQHMIPGPIEGEMKVLEHSLEWSLCQMMGGIHLSVRFFLVSNNDHFHVFSTVKVRGHLFHSFNVFARVRVIEL